MFFNDTWLRFGKALTVRGQALPSIKYNISWLKSFGQYFLIGHKSVIA
jgi:hypothetical protein